MSSSDKRLLNYEEIQNICRKLYMSSPKKGFEFHPFQIGWYNDCVQRCFHLPYDHCTVAFVVLSTPAMFENYFLAFLKQKSLTGLRDPIDECVADHFGTIEKELDDYNLEIIYDFEVHPTRRPKVLVQTAGHVAGAARYYQRSDVKVDPWNENQRICGVSIHPKYGGWFAFRGIMILKNVLCEHLPIVKPPDVIDSDEKRIELLEKFNYHWNDWTFRDIILPEETYSELQRRYFQTKPADRHQLIIQLQNDQLV